MHLYREFILYTAQRFGRLVVNLAKMAGIAAVYYVWLTAITVVVFMLTGVTERSLTVTLTPVHLGLPVFMLLAYRVLDVLARRYDQRKESQWFIEHFCANDHHQLRFGSVVTPYAYAGKTSAHRRPQDHGRLRNTIQCCRL